MNNPEVSIITPTYNSEAHISKTIESVLKQTFSDWEMFIVDDCSTDSTGSIVEKYSKLDPRIHYYRLNKNSGGPATPRNYAISKVKDKYVAFLDADDWWTSQKLDVSLKYLKQGADIVYHDLFLVKKHDKSFRKKKVYSRELPSPVFSNLVMNGNAINNSSVVLKKRLLDVVGKISEDPDLVAAEDYELWLRIAKVTEKFIRIPQTLGYYWFGGGNITNPRRVLTYLDVLEDRYCDQLDLDSRKKAAVWFGYVRGISHFALGSNCKAREFLKLIKFIQAPFSIYLKSRWIIAMIHLRYILNRLNLRWSN